MLIHIGSTYIGNVFPFDLGFDGLDFDLYFCYMDCSFMELGENAYTCSNFVRRSHVV